MTLTKKAEKILIESKKSAVTCNSSLVMTEHILAGILAVPDCAAYEELKRVGLQSYNPIKFSNINPQNIKTPLLSPKAEKIFYRGQDELVGSLEILDGLINCDAYAGKILRKCGISVCEVKKQPTHTIPQNITFESSRYNRKKQNQSSSLYLPVLEKYSRNPKNPEYCFGREKEIISIINTLSRRRKNNPCLVGEAGVGKTAIIEGVCRILEDINSGIKSQFLNSEITNFLYNKRIYFLDISSLISGARYRGDFEERASALFNEIKGRRDVILFIDEIHIICGAGGAEGAIDFSNIIKPLIARGEISLIGATTIYEYEKFIGKDPALERRFSPVEIAEPDEKQTIDILSRGSKEYEKFHNVTYNEKAIKTAYELSEKYFPSRFQPDKSFDLLDLAGGKFRGQNIGEKEIYTVLKCEYTENSGNLSNLEEKYYYVLKDGDEYAKNLADKYFGGHLIKIDFAGYTESTSISKIIGAPPGYAGYDDNTSLASKIRRTPLCVILAKNISKSSLEVKEIITSLLSDPIIEDSRGRKVNFKNVVFVFQTEESKKAGRVGFSLENADKGENSALSDKLYDNSRLSKELEKLFGTENAKKFKVVVQ